MIRTAVWDLETSNLKPDVGRILCAVVKSFPSGEVHVFRNDDTRKKRNMADDAALAEKIRDCLESHHIVVGHNSKGFDWPFLTTRLAAAGKRLTAPRIHYDTLWFVKGWRGIDPRNGKLATVAEFFDLPDRKMEVDVKVWIDAALGGDSKAMDILVERCMSDVEISAQVAEKLLDLGVVTRLERYP